MSEHHTLMYIPISMVPAVQSIMPGPNGEPARCVVISREDKARLDRARTLDALLTKEADAQHRKSEAEYAARVLYGPGTAAQEPGRD